jgi:hypothetical protein
MRRGKRELKQDVIRHTGSAVQMYRVEDKRRNTVRWYQNDGKKSHKTILDGKMQKHLESQTSLTWQSSLS